MPAPSAAPTAPSSQALHRTQFIRGVRDSMAKALAQGLGDPPAEMTVTPIGPPPASPQRQDKPKPTLKQSPARMSITGRFKQLMGVGGSPDGSGDLPATEPLPRPPPPLSAAPITVTGNESPLRSPVRSPVRSPMRSPVRVLNLPDQLVRSPGRVLVAVDQQRQLRPAPPPAPPAATNLKPIVRLPEGSPAESPGAEPPANGEASEERKRMIALAQLKILQRKSPGAAQGLTAQESLPGGVGSPLKTYGRRAELVAAAAAAAANGAADTPPPPPPPPPPPARKNVKLMPPLTLLVPPVKSPVPPPSEMMKPDVEDASRCASGLLIRKTYYKAAAAAQQQQATTAAAAGSNGSLQAPLLPPPPPPEEVMVRRSRGRPRRAAVAAAAVVAQGSAVPPPTLTASPLAAAAAAAAVPPPPPSPSPSTASSVSAKSESVSSSSGVTPTRARGRRLAAAGRASPATQSTPAAPATAAVPAVSTAPVVPASSATPAAAQPASSAPSSAALSPSAASASSLPTSRKRRHVSSGVSSGTSSGRSSADPSPRPKKTRTPRDLKSLFADEGAINILSEMKALNGEKRRTRMPSTESYKRKSSSEAREGPSGSAGPSPRPRLVTSVRGSLRALPAAGLRSPLKKHGLAANKIKARALKVKKQAEAKKAAKAGKAMTTSQKLKALKAKIKEERKSPSPSPKPTPKAAEKATDKASGAEKASGSGSAGSSKTVTQKTVGRPALTAAQKMAKANKGLSATAIAAKKLKAAVAADMAAGQLKLKKQAVATASTSSAGAKKSPPRLTLAPKPVVGTPAASGAVASIAATAAAATSASQKQPQPKLAQDRNLNIIERKTSKEVKNGERKRSTAEDRQPGGSRSASRDKSASPSSKSSSKSSSPLPMAVAGNAGVPTSPSTLSYSSLQRRLEVATLKQVRRKEAAGDRERSSSRSNLGTVRHREICVKKFDRFHQLILCPVTTRLKAGINVQVMREIREYLSACERDPSCRAVLLTSSAGPFCQGLDYTCLLGLSPEKRRKAAEDLAKELKEFVRAVAGFSKPLVAGVTGACVGLGVSLLPLCDLVYVTEKATLQLPYSRLGTVPEGGATHSLTALLGHAKAGAMVLTGRAMTGTEAVSASLATGLVWSATAYEELIALARQMLDDAAQLQSLESTKALLRHSLRAKLEQALHSECRLLVHQWSAPEFQQRVRRLYEEGGLLLQKADFNTQ